MTIDARKYVGWPLDSISLEVDLFTVNLARHSVPAAAAEDLENQRLRARITFNSRKVILSNVHYGAEISEVSQGRDAEGDIHCILKFSPGSFIEVYAREIAELLF
jgi:hypothetical protein